MFVTEGNRYNVRGDIAFAQSIVETAWFNYPDYGLVRPSDNNFAGHRRMRFVWHRLRVHERAQRRARPVAAAPQLRRRRTRASPTSPTRPCPSSGAALRRRRTTTSTTTSRRVVRRSGTTWVTATGPPRPTTDRRASRLQPDADLQRCAVRRVVRPPGAPTRGNGTPSTTASCSCATPAPASESEQGRAVNDEFRAAAERARQGNLEKEGAKLERQGKLFVRDRLALLLDEGSFVEQALLANAARRRPACGRCRHRRRHRRRPAGVRDGQRLRR